ncbi:MAG: T9SS type A sorting domain-containing protein [Crocinitomicaceae bacterium]
MKRLNLFLFSMLSIWFGNAQTLLPAVQADNQIIESNAYDYGNSSSVAISPDADWTAIAYSRIHGNPWPAQPDYSTVIRWYDDNNALVQEYAIEGAIGADIEYGHSADIMMISYSTYDYSGVTKVKLARFVLQSNMQYAIDFTQDIYTVNMTVGIGKTNLDLNEDGQGAVCFSYSDPGNQYFSHVKLFDFDCYNPNSNLTDPFHVVPYNGYPLWAGGFYGAAPDVAIQENDVILLTYEFYNVSPFNSSNPPVSDLRILSFTPSDFISGNSTHSYSYPGIQNGIKHSYPRIAVPKRNFATWTSNITSDFTVTYLRRNTNPIPNAAQTIGLFFEENSLVIPPSETTVVINNEFPCDDINANPVVAYQKDRVLVAWRQFYITGSPCVAAINSVTMTPANVNWGNNFDVLLEEYDYSGTQLGDIIEVNQLQTIFNSNIAIGAGHEYVGNPNGSNFSYHDAIFYPEVNLSGPSLPKYWKQRNTDFVPLVDYSQLNADDSKQSDSQSNYHMIGNDGSGDILNIINDKEELTNYTFYSILGSQIINVNVSSSARLELIDISRLPEGVYIVKCTSSSFDETIKFIK